MAKMLREGSTKYYGHCDFCASGQALHLKPGPRERHQARAREKAKLQRELRREQD